MTTDPSQPVRALDATAPQKVSYAISLWLRDEQVRVNTAMLKARIEPHYEVRAEPIALVCYGPSLNQTWEEVRAFKHVMTCSGSHRFLIDRGIVPQWHIDVDPREHKMKLIGEPHPDVEYLLASTCHPKYFRWLLDGGFNVKLWHVFDGQDEAMRVLPPGEWALTGGCSVGLRALAIAHFLGFRDLHVFGMDGNEGPSGKHAAAHPNQAKEFYTTEYKGVTYRTTPAILEAARQTWHELNQLKDAQATFHGEGLVQAMAKDYVRASPAGPVFLAFNKPELISAEMRDLNAKLHDERLDYGVGGGRHADTVTKLRESTKAASVLDYGAGKGYLAKALPFPIWEYDPAIPEKAMSPRPADLVICFPAGTLVSGAGPIEELSLGHSVMDSRGLPQEVTKAYERVYSGDLVKLRVACLPDISMTPEHPVLVSSVRRVHRGRGRNEPVATEGIWKAARDVMLGDWVSIPRIAETRAASLSFQHGRGHRWITRPVDTEVAWLLGLYTAEGFTSDDGKGRRVLTMTLSAKERGLAARAVAALDSIGVHGWISQSPARMRMNGLQVMAASYGLPSVVDAWCGKGAAEKKVPDAILSAPLDIVGAFIDGLVDGDGCLRSDRRNSRQYRSITTVSRRLALGLLSLLHKFGFHASVSNPMENRGHIQGRRVNARPVYLVQWSVRTAGKAAYGRGRFIGDRIYLPVTASSLEPVTNVPVFNVATRDETYGVPYIVHNCTDVLEHVEPDKLQFVLGDLARCVLKFGYFVIHTGPAKKCYADGRNTHLIQQGLDWWRAKLGKHFTIAKVWPVSGVELHLLVQPKVGAKKKLVGQTR